MVAQARPLPPSVPKTKEKEENKPFWGRPFSVTVLRSLSNAHLEAEGCSRGLLGGGGHTQ